ncbi:uncharacterized protein [Apostichopus japonicus]|uniref:uncharacterized protein isoform X2 n=1 Tax=Stichopus japonicus TaxID=307972 RepID=UPI003AB78AB3
MRPLRRTPPTVTKRKYAIGICLEDPLKALKTHINQQVILNKTSGYCFQRNTQGYWNSGLSLSRKLLLLQDKALIKTPLLSCWQQWTVDHVRICSWEAGTQRPLPYC